LFRFLITGAFAVVLTAAAFGVGAAAETSAPAVVAVSGAAADAATATVTSDAHAPVEVAAPTAGADLAMWGVAPSDAAAAETSEAAGLNGSRLVRRFADGILHRSASIAVSLTRNAMRFLGVPYAFGGTSASGFDCSGFVQHVYAALGLHLPRTADAQYTEGMRVRGALVRGDLVFFETYSAGASHVGIYLGNDEFVHASSSRGVTVSSLHERYWSARYLGAKRLL
jgi:cell wall-associated NlpC family hydrolase